MFRTRYNSGDRLKSSPVGERYDQEYEYSVVNGYEELVPSGVVDLQEKIRESFESTKLINIIARFNAGDLNALTKVQGVFADISRAPKSLQEAQNMRILAENAFDDLPLDIREKFGNSALKFLEDGGIAYLKDYIDSANYKAPAEAEKGEKDEQK